MAVNIEAFRERVAEAPAFPTAEYERRISAAQSAMRDQDVDLLLLFDPQSVCYFTGYTSVNLWDLAAVLVAQEGPPKVVLWDFEVPRYEASGTGATPITYASHADPIETVVAACAGTGATTIGIDDWTPSLPPSGWDRLRRGLDARLEDPRRILWGTRLRKSMLELERLERSAQITDIGVTAASDAVREGVTDHEIAAAAAEAMLRAGSGHFSIQPIVAVGPRAGVAHSEAGGRSIAKGEGIFLELGGSVDRYTAPVMRTLVCGEPRPELQELASVASRAVEEAVSAIKPGRPCAEVARTVHEVIKEGGSDILFHGYVGYPIGVSFPPSWLENLGYHIHLGNEEPLEEGMTFHLPISLRHRGERGVGLSYSIVVTETGARVLSGSRAVPVLLDG